MSLFAKNRVQVGASYGDTGKFPLDPNTPINKLTLIVQGDSIMLEVSEEVPPAFTGYNEMEVLTGFNVRTFKEPIYGFRFRSRSSVGSTVTFVAQ